MEIGEKIKHLRKLHGLTLEQVGQIVGVGKSTVRKWEEGDIKNMRRDKIVGLAKALHTTPAYLMEWTNETEPWTSSFRESVALALANTNSADLNDSAINLSLIEAVAYDNYPISLEDACSIADELGESLDEMVGFEKEKTAPEAGRGLDSQIAEIMIRLQSLPLEKRNEAISYIRYLADNANK